MSADCVGEPPGELITRTTAESLGMRKARSSAGATLSMESPLRAKPPRAAMTPESLTTATRRRLPLKSVISLSKMFMAEQIGTAARAVTPQGVG